jgi:hypothetical protein
VEIPPFLKPQGGESEVVAVLNNVRKPLKLGYLMVKNRSQKGACSSYAHTYIYTHCTHTAIEEGMSLDVARQVPVCAHLKRDSH